MKFGCIEKDFSSTSFCCFSRVSPFRNNKFMMFTWMRLNRFRLLNSVCQVKPHGTTVFLIVWMLVFSSVRSLCFWLFCRLCKYWNCRVSLTCNKRRLYHESNSELFKGRYMPMNDVDRAFVARGVIHLVISSIASRHWFVSYEFFKQIYVI